MKLLERTWLCPTEIDWISGSLFANCFHLMWVKGCWKEEIIVHRYNVYNKHCDMLIRMKIRNGQFWFQGVFKVSETYRCSSSSRAMILSSSPRSSLSTAWRIWAGLWSRKEGLWVLWAGLLLMWAGVWGWLKDDPSPPKVWQYCRIKACSSSLQNERGKKKLTFRNIRKSHLCKIRKVLNRQYQE